MTLKDGKPDLDKIPLKAKELYPGMYVGYFLLLSRTRENPKHSAMTRKRWRVQCTAPNCNVRLTIPANYLIRRPNPRFHCGCQDTVTLRMQYPREHGIWTMMQVRCYNPNHVAFKHYGGRGIKVCEAWRNLDSGFEQFIKDIGPAPTELHTLDRIDVDGNYEPIHPVTGEKQVRWATAKEQANNTRAKKAERAAMMKTIHGDKHANKS